MVWKRILWWSSISSMVCTVLLTLVLLGGTSWLAAAYTRAHPLNMAPYIPRIEAFLAGQGLHIKFGGLELFYDDGLVMRADGIQVLGDDGTLGVFTEQAAVRLANRNLWRLQAAPKSIEAKNVTLRVLRKADRVQLAGFEMNAPRTDEPLGGGDLLDWLNKLGTDGNLWGRLKDVRVSGLTLLIRDDVQQAEWVLENGNLSFSSYEDVGARGSISALIRRLYGGREIGVIPVLVTLEHTPGDKTALMRARFDQTDVALVADYLPPNLRDFLKARGQIDLSTELGADNRIGVPLVTLRLADVSVLPPKGYNEAFHFRRLVLAASYAPAPADVLTIRQVDVLTKGGMAFWGRGRVANVSTDPYLDLALASPGGNIVRIYEFFPDYDTRDGSPEKWVQWLNQNISDTQVSDVRATLRGRLGAFPHCAGECGVSVSAAIANGKVKFLHNLPPVTGVKGIFGMGKVMYSDGTSGTELWVRSPGGGTLGTQQVGKTDVRVTNLFHAGVGHVVVSATFAGALGETMQFVNSLDVSSTAAQPGEPVVPGTYAGQQTTDLWLDIPMIKGRDARLDEIGMQVSSSLTGVGVSGIDDVPGFSLAGAKGTVRADKGKLDVALAGTFDGLPLSLKIQDNLVMSVVSKTANMGIDINGGLPAAFILRTLSGTDAVSLTGAVNVKAVLKQRQDKGIRAWQFDGTADALGAQVELVPLGWNKPRGAGLNMAAKGTFVPDVRGNGGRLELTHLKAQGNGVDVQGKLDVPFDNVYASSAALQPFVLGRTNAAVEWQGGALKINGKALDVSGHDLFESSTTPNPKLNMGLNLELGVLHMKNGRLDDVNAKLDAKHGVWNITRFAARVDGEHAVNVAETELGNGGRRLSLSMTNVGRTLQTLGLYDKLRGGTMSGDIVYSDAKNGKGTLFMDNFELLNPPLLLRLLGLVSLQQLVAGTDSVIFDKARIPLVMKGDVVQLDKVLATGPSLSMRLNGDYNRAAKKMDIDGSMAPAIPFNRLVSRVPILGTLLTGSQDGLVVADFRLKGAVADPEISVQPLSVLTPGLLKDLFRMGSGR